jgi:hypothetical protein
MFRIALKTALYAMLWSLMTVALVAIVQFVFDLSVWWAIGLATFLIRFLESVLRIAAHAADEIMAVSQDAHHD